MTSTSEVIPRSAQKSSISWVSRIPPMSEPASRLRPKIRSIAPTGRGASGAPTSAIVPLRLRSARYGFTSKGAETVPRMKSKLPACFAIASASLDTTTSCAPRRIASCVFPARRREDHDRRAEGVRELHRHVPEPAQTHDPHLLPLADVPVPQRRVGRDARAQERRDRGEVEAVRDPQNEVLVDDDAVRVTAVGHAAEVDVRRVVGERRRRRTVLLLPVPARRAGAAGVDEAADRREVPFLEAADGAPHARHAADDLVTGDAGVRRRHVRLPLVADLVQVGVADPAVEDVDPDVLRPRLAARDGHLRERRARVGRGKGPRFERSRRGRAHRGPPFRVDEIVDFGRENHTRKVRPMAAANTRLSENLIASLK